MRRDDDMVRHSFDDVGGARSGAKAHFPRELSPLVAFIVCIAAVISPLSSAVAHSYKLGSISIGHVWAPPPADGADELPVYGAILNQGENTATLAGASTPVAGNVRLRRREGNDVSWPESITLVPNKPFGLAKWREHLWVTGLKSPVKAGDTFELTLDFGTKGKVATTVIVEDEAGH